MSHSAMPATIEHTASQRSSVGLPAAAAAVQEEHLETSPQPQLTMLQSLGSIPGVSAAATVHAGRTSEDSEENVDVGDGQEEDVKQIGGGGEVGRIIAAEHTDQMDNKTEEVGLRKEEEMELNAKSAGERSDSMPEIGLVDHVFRAGDKVLAIRNQVARNALAPTDNLNEHVSEGGVGTVPVSEFLKWKTTGSEHIGTLIGKRFMGKMYLGQVVAWNTGEDSGLQKYKVIFHDNDVHAIELPDVISCKDNVTPRLQSAKNLHALCGYVSRWQAVYGRLVKQKQKSSEGAEAGAKEESQWFPATVKAVKGDGFFFVSWQDGYALDRTKCTFELRHLPSKLKDLCEGSKQIPDDTELKEAVNVRSEMPEIGLTKDMNDEPEYAIGTCVRMLFDDGVWYRGWVKKFHHRSNKYTVEFEDGDQQQTHLPGEDVEPLDAKMKEAARLHNMVEPQIGQMLFLYWSGMGRYTGSVSKRHNQGKFLATFCDGDKVLLTRTEVVFGSKIFHDVFMRGNDTVPCACGRAQCRTYFDDQGNFNEDMEVDKSMNKQMPQELESSMKLHGKQREQGEEETARNETKGQKRECGEGAAEAALNELCCCKSGKLFRDCHFLQIQKRESGDRANGSKDDQEGRANKKIRGPTVRGDKTQARDVKRASEGDGTVLEASQEEAGAVQKLGLKCGDFDQPRSKTQEMEAVQDEKRSETKTCNEAGAYGPEVLQGKVDIYWSLEKRWFRGIIDKFNPKTGKHHVRYDDGDKRWYDLQTLGKELRWVKDKPDTPETAKKQDSDEMALDTLIDKQINPKVEIGVTLHGKQREQGEEETARNETKGQKRECGEGAAEAALNELCCCKSGKLFRDCHFLQIQKRESGDRANGSKDDQEGRANKKIRGPTVRGDKTQARDVKRASEGDGTVLEASQEEAGAVQKLGLKCGDFDQPRSKTQEMEAVQDEKRSETKTCNEAGAYGPEVLQGKVDIYWSLEKRWFRGIIDKFNPKTGKHHVRYDDGDKRWYDLQTLGKELRWVKDKPEKQEKVRKEKRKRRVPEKNVCYEEGDGEIYEKSDGDCSLRAAAAILIQADSNDDRLVKNDKYKHRRRIKVVSDSDNDSDYEHSRSSKARHGTFLGNKGDEENGSDEGKFSTGAAAHDGDKDV